MGIEMQSGSRSTPVVIPYLLQETSSSNCPFFATMLGSKSFPDGNVSHIEGKHVYASGSVTS
eukprot:scaffold17_cov354-Pavlova_lutheri.AAC.46